MVFFGGLGVSIGRSAFASLLFTTFRLTSTETRKSLRDRTEHKATNGGVEKQKHSTKTHKSQKANKTCTSKHTKTKQNIQNRLKAITKSTSLLTGPQQAHKFHHLGEPCELCRARVVTRGQEDSDLRPPIGEDWSPLSGVGIAVGLVGFVISSEKNIENNHQNLSIC